MIEAYTREAIQEKYAVFLRSGELAFTPLNVELPETRIS